MAEKIIKRVILGLISVSFFGMFTVLCVIIEPGDMLCMLMTAVFAFIWVGVDHFFCIAADDKKAVYTSREFSLCGYGIPLIAYCIFAAADILDIREWFIRTAAAVTITITFRLIVLLKDGE